MDWILADDRPIFQQLYEQLARRIVAGFYPPGSRLPSVRDLAAEAGVNPNTMQRALAQLEQTGLAESNRTTPIRPSGVAGLFEGSRGARLLA